MKWWDWQRVKFIVQYILNKIKILNEKVMTEENELNSIKFETDSQVCLCINPIINTTIRKNSVQKRIGIFKKFSL